MENIALISVYCLIFSFHCIGVICIVIVILDREIHELKSILMALTLSSLIPIIISDALIIYALFFPNDGYQDYYKKISSSIVFLELYGVYMFLSVALSVAHTKTSLLFRGIAAKYYIYLRYFLYIKFYIPSLIFFVGVSFSSSSSLSMRAVVAIHACATSVLGIIFLIMGKCKVDQLKLGTEKSVISVTILGSDGDNKSNRKLTDLEIAFLEVNGTFYGGFVANTLGWLPTLIFLIVFNDGSVQSGFILLIPFKIAINIGAAVIPIAHFKAKYHLNTR